ncbi:ComF family protein [Leptothoe sp. PORK10 BA2]|uniref:ComF family protein n=1 Tax=Leptothoe sp. PORK10 BA2 TaxID=3110254 RepID=UPI002B21DCD4|nr:ComF family protein [Leptothoe sp. PORK10 BA2]MEA5463987.1 ComF family protein [Leptothoe sp. PORK10 BA2]
MALSKILRQFTQVFLAASCPLCQRNAAQILCTDCYRQLLDCRWPNPISGHTATLSSHRASTNHANLSVFSWGQYRGVLKQTLAKLKYGNQAELGLWLGCQLGQHWRTHGPYNSHHQPLIVVPIPLHDHRLRQRGYNQAALIAQGFCRVTGLPMAKHGLIRIRSTDTMYTLGAKERQANVAGAFQTGPSLKTRTRSILLMDDIYTTGSTAQAAASALIDAGYKVQGITAVAQAVFSSPRDG